MSGIFNNNDLQEMSSNFKSFKEQDEKKCLELLACDPLFHTIRDHAETNAATLRQTLKDELLQGRKSVKLWSCKETTFYRAPGASYDCRDDSFPANPEVTYEEVVNQAGWNYAVQGTQGGYYKVGRTLKLTNCLFLLDNYFGPHFSCSLLRSRSQSQQSYHVYDVDVWLCWTPVPRSDANKQLIDAAVAAYNVRNLSADPAAEEIPCEYCGNLYTHAGCGPANDYCSTICYRRDSGVCDY